MDNDSLSCFNNVDEEEQNRIRTEIPRHRLLIELAIRMQDAFENQLLIH